MSTIIVVLTLAGDVAARAARTHPNRDHAATLGTPRRLQYPRRRGSHSRTGLSSVEATCVLLGGALGRVGGHRGPAASRFRRGTRRCPPLLCALTPKPAKARFRSCKILQRIPGHVHKRGFSRPRWITADPDFPGSAVIGLDRAWPTNQEVAGSSPAGRAISSQALSVAIQSRYRAFCSRERSSLGSSGWRQALPKGATRACRTRFTPGRAPALGGR